MNTLRTRAIFFSLITVFALTLCGCSSGDDNHQYLLIPNAEFISGTPTGTQAATAQQVVITQPTNGTTYTVNQTYTWKVDFTAITEIQVEYIIIEVEDVDGYFVYPLTDEEIAAGFVEIETEVVDTEPVKEQVCNRDYRGNGVCYEKADEGVTGMDFSAANGSTTTLSWTPPVEETVLIPVVEEDEDDEDYSGATCSGWTTYCSCSIRACVSNDASRAWYDVGSGIYECASPTNCYSAAESAVNWCTRGC